MNLEALARAQDYLMVVTEAEPDEISDEMRAIVEGALGEITLVIDRAKPFPVARRPKGRPPAFRDLLS